MIRRILVCVAIAACGGSGPVHRPGEQYLGFIQIVGNHAIPTDALVNGLILHRRIGSRRIDEYQMKTDVERIAGAYQKLGYFGVDVHARVDHHGDEEVVVFTIDEGPRAATRVELIGVPSDVPEAKARALIKLREGGPFDYNAYDAAKAPLLKLVEDAGYAHAQLDASVVADAEHRLAIARYVIDPGPICTFGPISIAGAEGPLADAIRARLELHEGERYSAEAVAATERALYAMGRFSTVHVDVDRQGASPVVAVKIGVSVGNSHELRAGGGLGLDPVNYSVRGRLTYSQIGWPFPLSTSGVDFKPEFTLLRDCSGCQIEPRMRLLGTLTQQDFLVPLLRAEVEGGLDFLTIEAYTNEGARARLGLAAPLWTPRVQGRIGWTIAGYHFTDLNIDAATAHLIGVDHFERLGAFTQSVIVDLRDQPIEPRYGAYAELRVAEGTRYAGGAYEYVQVTPELRGYVPLGPLVLAARARYGRIFGDVPPTERFYAGGASSDRGFPERQLSPAASNPRDGSAVVIGGAGLIESGLELRVPFTKTFGGVAFVDAGDVELDAQAVSIANLHYAGGIGIRLFLLPIGPIRLDIAYRWGHDDPVLAPANRFNYFLGVGEAF